MPIYEYICEECGSQFDSLRTMSNADTPIPCIQCSSNHTSRKISVFFAQSGGRVIASDNTGSCAGCQSNSCATCG